MNERLLTELQESAEQAALKAGELIASYRNEDVDVLPKEGGDNLASSVVTEVDFRSQEIILDRLSGSRERYGLGLLTEEEEDDGSRFATDAFWCIDPIDGTLPFTESQPGYAVSIGLVSRDGTPLLGVVYDPLTSTLYTARRGRGAWRNRREWTVSADVRGRSLAWVIDRDQPALELFSGLKARLEQAAAGRGCSGVRLINNGGAVLNACWALEQAPGLYFKIPKPQQGGGCLWDFAASACIITEAGGLVRSFSGASLNLNAENPYLNGPGVMFLSSPDLADLAAEAAAASGFTWS